MLTYGFHNSVGGDRSYDAVQLSSMFDGVIADGVFSTVGESLVVTVSTGMNVLVGSGKAWFNHTWTVNDIALSVAVPAAEMVLDRIDTLVLEVNSTEPVRANAIKFVSGTPHSSPVRPTLTNEENVHQYPLADVYVAGGATSITAPNITNRIGTVACPFVTGLLDQIEISTLLAQWEAEFNAWFAMVEDILDESTAGNLLNLINTKAAFKNGSDVLASGTNSKTVTDAFITENTAVTISPLSDPSGIWKVVSSNGSFEVTSTESEPLSISFAWWAVK